MSRPLAIEVQPGQCEISAEMLREDHRILLLLLNRCGQASDCHSRRDIMQLVVDLFEVHSAICAQTRLNGESMPERLAVSELMDQVEGTDARSRLHFARSVALAPVLEAYVAREELEVLRHAGIPLHLEQTPGNRALLREHGVLVTSARQLLRLH